MTDIISLLIDNGNTIRVAIDNKKSLDKIERNVLMRNRQAAYDAKYTWPNVFKIENEGYFGETGMGTRIGAVFAYEDFGGMKIKKRMYNIMGISANRQSTVDCAALFAQGICPNDLSWLELIYHAGKAFVSNLYVKFDVTLYDVQKKLTRKIK